MIQRSNLLFKRIKIINQENIRTYSELKALFFNFLLQLHLFGTEEFNNICKIYEFGYIKKEQIQYKHNIEAGAEYLQPELYCIMEYGGNTLSQYIQENKDIDINFVNKIILQCAKCVKIIHDLNYVHFDISLDNFLIIIKRNQDINIKIIDYGELSVSGSDVKQLKGNPLYLSPNIPTYGRINYIADKSFDIFSLGCVYMYLLHSIIPAQEEYKNFVLPYKYTIDGLNRQTLHQLRKLYNTKKYIDIKDEIIPIDIIKEILEPFLNLKTNKPINITYDNIIKLENLLSNLCNNEEFKTTLLPEIGLTIIGRKYNIKMNIENISQLFIENISQLFIDKISDEIDKINTSNNIADPREHIKKFIIKFFSFVKNIDDYLSREQVLPLYEYEIDKLIEKLSELNTSKKYSIIKEILRRMIESHNNINDIISVIPNNIVGVKVKKPNNIGVNV